MATGSHLFLDLMLIFFKYLRIQFLLYHLYPTEMKDLDRRRDRRGSDSDDMSDKMSDMEESSDKEEDIGRRRRGKERRTGKSGKMQNKFGELIKSGLRFEIPGRPPISHGLTMCPSVTKHFLPFYDAMLNIVVPCAGIPNLFLNLNRVVRSKI